MAFGTPVVEHWLNSEIAQWGIDPTTYCTMSGHSTMELHLTPIGNTAKIFGLILSYPLNIPEYKEK